jgi:branched-chain amino acid transport system permease protein
MDHLPTAVCAAIGIAIFERCVFWAYRSTTIVEIALLAVIVVALLTQRRSLSRADVSVTGGWAAADEVRPVPAILASHPTVRAARRWAIAIGAIVVVGYPFAMSPSQVYLGATYAIFGMIAVSLVVLTGWGGQISLGQFALVAVGAMTASVATVTWGLPFVPAMVLATAAGAGIAVLLGLPALRIQGLFLAVTTMAFAVTLLGLMADRTKLGRFLPRVVERPKLFIAFEDDRAYYFLCLAALALTVVVVKRLRTTRTGRVLIAMRDNERAAQSFSLSLLRVRLVTFAVAGAIAGAAGGLLAHQQHGVRVVAFAPEASLQVFLMAVIGGLGSVGGVLTGAIYLGTVHTFVGGTLGRLLASGGGVLLILIFFPGGIGGLLYRARDAFLRRIALREKIWVPSVLGDVRTFDPSRNVAPLAAKTDASGSRVKVPYDYELDSTIEEAGRSQGGKGWIYA